MSESRKMYNNAEEVLHKKGYYVDNMVYDKDLYEVSNLDGEIVMDYLTLNQLMQLSKLHIIILYDF